MKKLVAIINVISWAGFWAFGYLAIASEGLTERQWTIAAALAFAGLLSGVWAYLRLVRITEASGYAKPSSVLAREARSAAQAKWEG